MMIDFKKLSNEEERIAGEIVDCAFKVHTNLGPGLLEKIYESCFCHELKKKNLKFFSQVNIPIKYEGLLFNEGFRIDVIIEDKIICELKAVNEINPVFEAHKRLGVFINFYVPLIKNVLKELYYNLKLQSLAKIYLSDFVVKTKIC
ncbi:MAG: GxxExxY protein [Bacteroidota bacterium]|nr:GxxExxY protein [Bacteroidota bacterium]